MTDLAYEVRGNGNLGHTAQHQYRVLVTGSRSWRQPDTIYRALHRAYRSHPRLVVVHGGCPKGADQMAAAWCEQFHVPAEVHLADWGLNGRRAGIVRNGYMVERGADLCLAFIRDGSPGASHCAAAAERAGIEVRYFRDGQEPA